METKHYMLMSDHSKPDNWTVTLDKGEVSVVKSRTSKSARSSNDTWEFTFDFITVGKKRLKLGFCEMDVIARTLQLWRDAEPSWFDPSEKLVEYSEREIK